MARKANRYNAVAATSDQIQATPEKTFRAGLYARLSVEINERPSNSIQTQLDIMRGYVNRHPEIIEAFEYADSGFSGTNFERPNFNRLMDDVRAGKINCILVKDLSRFGRDYLETTNYIEIILPFLGVRFISVNDHFDTDAACNENKTLEIALKNLVNDMYAKDVSKRVSTVRRQEVERGKFTGSNAPYGYVVDDNDPLRHFLIDEPAAAVVRDMYQMADDGMSVREISLELQRRNLSIPGQYLKTGHLYQEEGDEVHIWHIGTIANILRKEEYIGNLVHGRRRSRLYENEKRHFTDKDEWVITENAHEPIVSREQFDRIREKFGKKVKESTFSSDRGAGTVKKADKYAGLLFCGECGKKLRFNSRMGRTEGDTSRTYFYQCCNTYDLSNQGYCSVTIMERMLDKIVMESMKMQMQLFSDKGITVEWCGEEAAKKLKSAEERVTKIQTEIAKLEYEDFEMHGRFGTGEINRDEMTAYHNSSEKKMTKLRERLSAAEDKQAAVRKDWDDYIHGIEALYRVNGKRKPDRDMLVALIKKISIKHNGEFTIEWNFDRKFKAVDGSYVKGAKKI